MKEHIKETLLRTDGAVIETIKGITLPIDVAKRYYKWYLSIAAKGCTDCNYKILDYPVTSASEERLVVGCHNIPRSEINYIAQKLGW